MRRHIIVDFDALADALSGTDCGREYDVYVLYSDPPEWALRHFIVYERGRAEKVSES